MRAYSSYTGPGLPAGVRAVLGTLTLAGCPEGERTLVSLALILAVSPLYFLMHLQHNIHQGSDHTNFCLHQLCMQQARYQSLSTYTWGK